jgi:hypothetical protein
MHWQSQHYCALAPPVTNKKDVRHKESAWFTFKELRDSIPPRFVISTVMNAAIQKISQPLCAQAFRGT